MPGADIFGLFIGAGLTVLVFTYLFGDNIIYRLVLRAFTGALLGYTFAIVLFDLLFARMAQLQAEPWLVIPVVIGLALFALKSIRRIAYLGNYPLAVLVGVGIAVALTGALMGTLVPQVEATTGAFGLDTGDPLGPIKGLVIVGGTICTLFAFDITLSPNRRGIVGSLGMIVRALGSVGRLFLTIALAVAFAGALTASLSFFIGRIHYLVDVLARVMGR
jgi:hypothetical protein